MITWKNIVKSFPHYKILCEGKEVEIVSSRITRTGLEFANFFMHKQLKAVVLWGKDEFNYLLQFNIDDIKNKLEKIFQLNPPLIILSRSFHNYELLVDLAKKYNVAVISTEESSANLTNEINTFLTESLSKQEFLHGNLIEMYGLGVLIIGASGMGKSETSLELIKKGHMFVADDAIVCKNVYGKILGRSPKKFFGFIEVRGLGIVNVGRILGIEKMKEITQINIVIELAEYNPQIHNFERLGKELQYKRILNVDLPYFLLPITPGKKTSDLIEITVAHLKLLLSGYNSFEEFIKKAREEDIE